MAVVRWEPFREVAALQGEMSRLMNQLWGTAATGAGNGPWFPSLDAWETDDSLVFALDLPGIAEDEVSIEVDDGALTISGTRERKVEQNEEGFHRFERRFGSFSRSVTLPPGTDESKIKAEFARGVLEITIPKPEERKPKRISIGVTKAPIEGKAERK